MKPQDDDALVHGVPGILWEADARTGQFLFVSNEAERLLGHSLARWTEEPRFLEGQLHPADRAAVQEFWLKAGQTGSARELECRMFSADGAILWLRILVTAVVENGEPRKLRGLMVDVTERKHSETLWKGEAFILDLAARGAPLPRVLEAICDLIEQESEGAKAAIWRLNRGGTKLRRGAAPQLPEALLERIEAQPVAPTSGAWGASVHLKEPVASPDLASDDLWSEMPWVTSEFGLRACWVTPILSAQEPSAHLPLAAALSPFATGVGPRCPQEKAPQRPIQEATVLGAVATFYSEPRQPTPRDREVGQVAARLAEAAIGRHQAERALRESEERFTLAALGVYDGLWDWNFETNEVYFSPGWKAMLGFEEQEIGTSPDEWFNRIHPEDLALVKAQLVAHVQGSTSRYESEYRIQHKDGSWLWLLSRGRAVRGAGGRASRLVGTETNVTEKKLQQEQLQHHAIHDTVTGLPNRALFMSLLGRTLGRANRRWDYNFAVLLLDLDRFKVVNESLGPSIGDHLLRAIAGRLQNCLRPGDAVARLGGDEFGILLDDIKEVEDATRIADRIQKDLSLPFELNDKVVYTSASIGISTSVHGYEQPDDMLRDADTALYRAKAAGRARHEVFETGMHTRAMALLQLDTDLRRALDQREFFLQYQPIVSLETGGIEAFEALARWRHPDRGVLSPGEFIPVAEETGLIVPIGWFVLREACLQMKAWRDQFPQYKTLAVSVNVSSKQLTEVDLVSGVKDILDETGLDPAALKLEITETVIMENAERAAAVLNDLRALNVGLMMDDFGTGYSSLSYLHHLPLDALKIDRFFIGNMDKKAGNSEIVRTILQLGHSLNMYVVAEGVETAEQMMALRDLDCTYAQGYYFSRPVDAAAVETLLAASPRWLEGSLVAAKPTTES